MRGHTRRRRAGPLFAGIPNPSGRSQPTRKSASPPGNRLRADGKPPTRQPLHRSAKNWSVELAAWTATRQQHRAQTPGANTLTRWEVAEVVLRFWLGGSRRAVKFSHSGYRI